MEQGGCGESGAGAELEPGQSALSGNFLVDQGGGLAVGGD